VDLEGEQVLVEVLRLGRLALFCRTLDGRTTGLFDVATERWRVLPGKFNRDIERAADIAAKRRPVELLRLPIGRIVLP
jgi:hypothetical protein